MNEDFNRIRELIPVIAGNMRQFQDWLRRNDLPGDKYRYVWEEHQLRGIRPEKLYLVGTYHENSAYTGIINHLVADGTEVIDAALSVPRP